MDKFTEAYITALLWSETDGDGDPLDANYSMQDIAPVTMARIQSDCDTFSANAGALLANMTTEQGGHDFALTRNRHGAGFWDRGLGAPGDALTEIAHSMGEFNLYVGDDWQVCA